MSKLAFVRYTGVPKPNSNKIDVSNLSSGKYIVEISTSNDYCIRKKLIIK